VLELEQVTAGYGDTVVLRDVSLSVPDATTVALLGPNGAGKTTLLRTAAGFIRPTSGRVMLDGEDVTGLPAHIRARRGLCHLP
jgi:branched-chain amino acid transport system ATP-binding protein